jgi:hypothetical protein
METFKGTVSNTILKQFNARGKNTVPALFSNFFFLRTLSLVFSFQIVQNHDFFMKKVNKIGVKGDV